MRVGSGKHFSASIQVVRSELHFVKGFLEMLFTSFGFDLFIYLVLFVFFMRERSEHRICQLTKTWEFPWLSISSESAAGVERMLSI